MVLINSCPEECSRQHWQNLSDLKNKVLYITDVPCSDFWATMQMTQSKFVRLIDFKSVCLARQKICVACFSGQDTLANAAR